LEKEAVLAKHAGVYKSEKRKKELQRLKKQEEKRQKRQQKDPEKQPEELQGEAAAQQPEPDQA